MYRKQTVDIQGSPMEILIFEPAGAGPHPGIVVAQHLPIAHAGLEKDAFTLDVGERLAAAGFACVIPWVFHWWTPDTDLQIKRDEFRDDRCVAGVGERRPAGGDVVREGVGAEGGVVADGDRVPVDPPDEAMRGEPGPLREVQPVGHRPMASTRI